MSTIFNAPNTQYNKDETFANLSLSNSSTVVFSEAVAKNGEDRVLIYAYVTELPKATDYSKGFEFKPCLCKFSLYKKDISEKVKTSDVQLLLINKLETQVGFDKPFSGLIMTEIPEKMLEAFKTGKSEGRELPPEHLKFMEDNFYKFEPLEALEKLEGKELSAPKAGSGGYGNRGGGMQKESERLNDRLAFIADQVKDGSKLQEVLIALGQDSEALKAVCGDWLSSLMQK